MKRNAAIRIVIWSLIIVCLTSILLAGLGLRSYRSHTAFDRTEEVAVTAIPHPLEDLSETVTLATAATVYSSPSTESGGHNGELDAGAEIIITRRELVNNQEWAYTTSPIQGWILIENLESPVVEATDFAGSMVYTTPASSEIYGSSMLTDNITSISVDWVSGNIHMIPTTDNRIFLEETESDRPMVWKLKNGKLSIEFSEERLALGITKSKDLVIKFPIAWSCQDLDIDAASSDILIQDLDAQKIEIDAASGRTEFVDCTVDSLEIDTASGDVYFVGSLDSMECDAASANFTATLTNHPRKLEMNSASGSLDLTLPGDTGFTVHMEGLKNVFAPNDFQVTKKNGSYVHGDGSCRIEMESMSGGVHLQKAKTT